MTSCYKQRSYCVRRICYRWERREYGKLTHFEKAQVVGFSEGGFFLRDITAIFKASEACTIVSSNGFGKRLVPGLWGTRIVRLKANMMEHVIIYIFIPTAKHHEEEVAIDFE